MPAHPIRRAALTSAFALALPLLGCGGKPAEIDTGEVVTKQGPIEATSPSGSAPADAPVAAPAPATPTDPPPATSPTPTAPAESKPQS